MSYKMIPLLSFLPSVIMIDDNQSFLDNFGMELEYKGFLKGYTNPREAIENINKRDTIFNSLRDYISIIKYDDIDNDDDDEKRSVNFDAIVNTTFNRKRFFEPAVIIVDYDMPEINGLEFCEYIKDHPSQKIMLTAEADEKIAVEAFNDGLINKFIIKDINTAKKDIITAINKHITQYFINFSKCLWQIGSGIFSCDAYINIFYEWIKEKNIVEHYSVSNNGSKIGITKDGKICWLVLNSKDELKKYIDVANDYALSSNIIEALKSGRSQLALLTENQKKEPASNWENYLVSIDGAFNYNRHNINYSFIDNFNIHGVDNTKIQKIYIENIK